MDFTAMNQFLTEESIKTHLEHLRQLKLKLSVMEKCYPEILGKDIFTINHLNLDRETKCEVTEIIKNIRAHEKYFGSFSMSKRKCERIKQVYSSVEKLIYDAYELARTNGEGFLFAYVDGRGRIGLEFSGDLSYPFSRYEPILALDAFEHAYFADYSFARDKYIKNALQYWNTQMIEEKLS